MPYEVSVKYTDLLAEGGDTPLTEVVSLKRVRPSPPLDLLDHYSEGAAVDRWDGALWWPGTLQRVVGLPRRGVVRFADGSEEGRLHAESGDALAGGHCRLSSVFDRRASEWSWLGACAGAAVNVPVPVAARAAAAVEPAAAAAPVCACCGTRTTPRWRRGIAREKLCNACAVTALRRRAAA